MFYVLRCNYCSKLKFSDAAKVASDISAEDADGETDDTDPLVAMHATVVYTRANRAVAPASPR